MTIFGKEGGTEQMLSYQLTLALASLVRKVHQFKLTVISIRMLILTNEKQT